MNELPSETGLAPQTAGPLQQHRGMVILVITLGILLIVGFAVVVGTIIYRAGGGNSQERGGNSQQDPAPAVVGEATMDSAALAALSVARPAGAVLVGVTSSANHMTFHFRDTTGDIVLVVDLANGAVISRVDIPADKE